MNEIGRFLIVAGVALVVGGLLLSSGHFNWLGRLPGDIAIKKENSSFYFPLTTCLLVSLVLTLILRLFKR